MLEEMITKTQLYNAEVDKIMKSLLSSFFYEEQLKLSSPDEHERDRAEELISKLLDKADKMYRFFDTAEEAKKTIRFLQTVSPGYAKSIFLE